MLKLCTGIILALVAINVADGNILDADAADLKKLEALINNYQLDPIDDPLIIDNFDLDLDTSFSNGCFAIPDGVINGLSGLKLDVGLTLNNSMYIKVDVTLPRANLSGSYISDATLLLSTLLPTLPNITLKGDAGIFARLLNVKIEIIIELGMFTDGSYKLFIKAIDIPISIGYVSLNLQRIRVNEMAIVWSLVNPLLKPIFGIIWPMLEGPLTTELVRIGSEIIKDCTLNELINNPQGCVNLGAPFSARSICIPPESTTTSTPTTTTPSNSIMNKPAAFHFLYSFILIVNIIYNVM